MKNLGLLIQELLQSKQLLLLIQLGRSLNLLGLIETPRFELVVEDFEVVEFLGVHASLDFSLVFGLLLLQELLLPTDELLFLVIAQLSKRVSQLASKPPTNSALDVECGILTLPLPHLRGEVGLRVNDLVLPSVDIDVFLFHLGSKLPHHDGGLCLVLVSLHYTFVTLRVVRCSLVGLREGMMIALAGLVVPETANVWLSLALFLDLDSHNLDLVVSKTDFNLEHGGHDEFVGLNRVKVMFLLLFSASTRDVHLILLPIKLNDIIFLHHVLLLLLLLHVHLFLLGILVLFLVHHLLLLFALHLYLMMALRGQAALILPTR